MEGPSRFFDTKIGRCMPIYKLIFGAISDGKFTIPINTAFNLGKEFYSNPGEAQECTVQFFIKMTKRLFPLKKFIAVLDGAFATVKYLKWALENNIATEVRMHGNRLVEYNGTKIQKQFDHICAVLLAYSIAQLEMKKCHYKNPESS